MSSWVRYSVAVYVGLLLAGALVAPRPQLSVGSGLDDRPRQLVRSDALDTSPNKPSPEPRLRGEGPDTNVN